MLQNPLNGLSGSPSDLGFELEAQVGIDHILSMTITQLDSWWSRVQAQEGMALTQTSGWWSSI